MSQAPTRDVVAVAFEDFQMLDVTGPLEVFSQATRLLASSGKSRGYRVHCVGPRDGALRASSGLSLLVSRLTSAPRRLDTLIVAGGRGTATAVADGRLIGWIRRASLRARRTTSVCTGAFLLARAGLLDGKRATTHWEATSALKERFPRVMVEPDRIFVKDGPVYTSAGVTAGMDLALALVAEDHGRALSLEVARQLVVFLQRPGGQAQFSSELALQASDLEPFDHLRAFIEENVSRDLTVPVLAGKAGMSPRNFARRFGERAGVTPARYVHSVRIAAARRRLEQSSHGLDRIAEETGFGSADALRRAFVAELGTTPSDYRGRFSTKGTRT